MVTCGVVWCGVVFVILILILCTTRAGLLCCRWWCCVWWGALCFRVVVAHVEAINVWVLEEEAGLVVDPGREGRWTQASWMACVG
jgi:hypothetical protein